MADLSARVAAAAAAALIGGEGMGAYADSLPPADPSEFAGELSVALGRPFRIAFLGWGTPPVGETPGSWTFSATVANIWRNDEATRSGMPLVVAASGARTKLRSLRSALPFLTEGNLRDALVSLAVSWLDTPGRNALWTALASMPDRFLLTKLIAFAAAAEPEAGRHSLPGREAMGMHHLGLLADPALHACRGAALAAQTLARNHDLVTSLRPLSKRHVVPLAAAARRGDPAAMALLAYSETGSPAALEGVTLAQASALLASRVHHPVSRTSPAAFLRPTDKGGEDARATKASAISLWAATQASTEAEPAPSLKDAFDALLARLLDAAPYMRFGVEVAVYAPTPALVEAVRAVAARRVEEDGVPFRLRLFHPDGLFGWRAKPEEGGGLITSELTGGPLEFAAALAEAPAHLAVTPFGALPMEVLLRLDEAAVWLALADAPLGFRAPGHLSLHGPSVLATMTGANGLAIRLVERTLAKAGLIPDAVTVRRTIRFAAELGIDPFPQDDEGCRSLIRLVAAAEWHRLRVPCSRLAPLAGEGIDLLACMRDAGEVHESGVVVVTGPEGFRHGAAGVILSDRVAEVLEAVRECPHAWKGLPARVLAVEIGSLAKPWMPATPAAVVTGPGGLLLECYSLLVSETPAGESPRAGSGLT